MMSCISRGSVRPRVKPCTCVWAVTECIAMQNCVELMLWGLLSISIHTTWEQVFYVFLCFIRGSRKREVLLLRLANWRFFLNSLTFPPLWQGNFRVRCSPLALFVICISRNGDRSRLKWDISKGTYFLVVIIKSSHAIHRTLTNHRKRKGLKCFHWVVIALWRGAVSQPSVCGPHVNARTLRGVSINISWHLYCCA